MFPLQLLTFNFNFYTSNKKFIYFFVLAETEVGAAIDLLNPLEVDGVSGDIEGMFPGLEKPPGIASGRTCEGEIAPLTRIQHIGLHNCVILHCSINVIIAIRNNIHATKSGIIFIDWFLHFIKKNYYD